MDRLVNADVKEVEVIFKPGEKCGGTFRLTNLMHAISAAVSLTSEAGEFSKPPLAIIPPLSSLPFEILFGPSDSPPLRSPPHAVTVRSTMIPTGKATPEDLRRIFSSTGRHVFVDAVIPVSFVGPAVVRFVTEADPELGLVAPFLAGALSGCTVVQVERLLPVAVRRRNFGAVSAMISAGACVHEDFDGRTPLHMAAGKRHVSILDLLLSVGGDLDARDERGITPLHGAVAEGHLEAAERLLREGACKYAVGGEGKAAYGVTAESGHTEGPQRAGRRPEEGGACGGRSRSEGVPVGSGGGRREGLVGVDSAPHGGTQGEAGVREGFDRRRGVGGCWGWGGVPWRSVILRWRRF